MTTLASDMLTTSSKSYCTVKSYNTIHHTDVLPQSCNTTMTNIQQYVLVATAAFLVKCAVGFPYAVHISKPVPHTDGSVSSSTQLDAKRRDILTSAGFSALTLLIGSNAQAVDGYVESISTESSAPKASIFNDSEKEKALYSILRVREATQQESRLIRSGKFKDLQRANVKLAVRFMLNNYKLGDNFVTAGSFLDSSKRIQAGEAGQAASQNLYTILEYFDAQDVNNLRVGNDSMAGKETLVLKGLDAARNNIDDFLSFFPKDDIEVVKTKIIDENTLNEKEFDVSSLGQIGNLSPEDIFK